MKPRVFKEYPLHVELWKWLAKHPDKEKEDWPGWKRYKGTVEPSYCFACAAARACLNNYNWNCKCKCYHCPIEWVEGDFRFCDNHGTPYYNFCHASLGSPDRTKYALEIAKLPLAKGWIGPKPRAYTCWVNKPMQVTTSLKLLVPQSETFTVYALDAQHARSVIARTQEVDYFMVGARLAKVEKRNFYEKRK